MGKRKYLCGLFDDVSPSLLNEHFLQMNLKQRLDQNLVVGAKLEAQLGNSDGRKTKKKKGKHEMGGLLVIVQVSNRWGFGR